MGIYDEYRDSNAAITLFGNRKAAASFIPTARKFAEVMQGKLDLGTNLGQDVKDKVVLDDNTVMHISLAEGVTNSMMKIEITSTLPTAPIPRQGVEIKVTTECPELPLSEPGARMFTHLFGHDPLSRFGFPNNVFEQTKAVKTQTPYILPSEEQGAYCSGPSSPDPGDGSELFHNQVELADPFTLMGIEFTTCYLHDNWLGIVSPNVFLSFSSSLIPLGIPCDDCNPQGSIFTPDPESLGPGNNFAVLMSGNFGRLCYPGNEQTYLIEGSVRVTPDDELGAHTNIISDDGTKSVVRDDEDGEQRQFACFSFAVGSIFQAEIVLMYASGSCPAAVGFFFDGADSAGPEPGFASGLVMSAACDTLTGVNPPFVPTDSGANCRAPVFAPAGNFLRFDVPAVSSGCFVGAQRQALAYTGCFDSRIKTGNDFAAANISSRSFWFELDRKGFPNGSGIHNGPLLSPEKSAVDLTFNI